MAKNRELIPASELLLIAAVEDAQVNADAARSAQKSTFTAWLKARGDNFTPNFNGDPATVAAHEGYTRACTEANTCSTTFRDAKIALTAARASRLRAARTARGVVHRANGLAVFSGRAAANPTAEDLALAEAQEAVQAAKAGRSVAQSELDAITAAASQLQVDRARAMERMDAHRKTVRDATAVLTRLERARANNRSKGD